MKKISLPILAGAAIVAAGLVGATAPAALAYDGTHCKAPGNCWEPKPGFPEKIAGSKYDPKHDPKELAKQGKSVIVVSSEMPELIGVCDRIMVMREGAIVGEVAGERMTENEIVVLATGVKTSEAA